jgi:hypothetical protein
MIPYNDILYNTNNDTLEQYILLQQPCRPTTKKIVWDSRNKTCIYVLSLRINPRTTLGTPFSEGCSFPP